MKNNVKIKLILSAALCAALMTGCPQSDDVSETETTVIPEFTEETDIIEGRKNIYLIVKNLTSSYWNVVIDGVRDAGNELDCNIFSSGSASEMQWELQSSLIDKAISEGADAIILAPNDSVNLASKVSEVYCTGVPVVLVDTVVNTENYTICYMTDNLRAGQNAAEEMIKRFEESGISDDREAYVAIQIGASISQTINERVAGFCQYWTKNAPEKWKIIDEVKLNEGNEDSAVTCAEQLLDKYSNINGVFGTNNCSTVGFARVIKNRERKDIAVVGFDYSDEMKELIMDKDYNAATMLQRQYSMGQYAVQSALDALDGKKSDIKFVDTGVVTVNSSTISDSEIQEILSHN